MHTLCDYLTTASRKYRDNTAVRYKSQSISYAYLDQMSSRLAATLAQASIGSGDRVGVWLNKSIEAVVAIHAILKVGGAYVPLDPIMPVKRAIYVLNDCQMRCLITTRKRLAFFDELFLQTQQLALLVLADTAATPTFAGIPVLAWSEALKATEHFSSSQSNDVSPDQLAYILYTSGSTGYPKGVMLSHRNGRVFVDWACKCFQLTADDRLSSHAPFHFDLSILDIFGAASVGASLVLIPENQQSLGVALVQLAIKEKISVWYSVPEALMRMIESENSTLLATSHLRVILFAGEVFPIKHLKRLRVSVPGAQLYNLYGPTETNVCTFYQISDNDVIPTQTQPVPIGKSCDYATTFVVNEAGTPLDLTDNAEGELCVCGDSVMLGYWNDPIKTAHRLIACPTSMALSGQAYRTGDIVRRDECGNYIFVGRYDHMVKSRGYRIELGEIEATLLSQEGVYEAAVVAIPDIEIGTQLEAYIVPHHGAQLVESHLHQHCLLVLPRYMLPENFHMVLALPRTQTGKIDRQALIAASQAQQSEVVQHSEVAPRGRRGRKVHSHPASPHEDCSSQTTIVTEAWFSRALKRTKRVNIILPPDYLSEQDSFPVLFLLHGYGGNKDTWLDRTALLQRLQAMKLIVVLPESGRRWFINDHEAYCYEDYLINELVPFVDQHFKTISDRNTRAIAGFSMGGAAALFQTLRHPDYFSIAVSHSGAFEAPLREGDPYMPYRNSSTLLIPSVESHERVWGQPGSMTRNCYDPYQLIRAWDHRLPIKLWLDVGTGDYERVVRMNRNVHQALLEKGVTHEYHEYTGGHDWLYVNQALPFSLAFVKHHLRLATASSTHAHFPHSVVSHSEESA